MPDRCFVALELPRRAVSVLQRSQTLLRDQAPAWRDEKWVSPELLHVTVAFLGTVPDPAFEGAMDALAAAIGRRAPIGLAFDGARAVPDRRHAQMVWATLATEPADLSALRDDVLAACGAPPDGRPFRAHVTLVRARRPRRVHGPALDAAARMLSDAGKTPDGTMSVPSLTVFSSTLGPSGPTYRELARLPLQGAPPAGRDD